MLSFFEQKALFWKGHPKISDRKQWYYTFYPQFNQKEVLARIRKRNRFKYLKSFPLPLHLSFLRWVLIDILNGKGRSFWGIYQFVALPGQGKTLSMVAHMERALHARPNLLIATNFNYKKQNFAINHWSDIVLAAKFAQKQGRPCIIAVDEIHITFDSSDWKSFPPELLALLSFNRKFRLQFLCSAQIYDRIPKKVRDIANYTVVCKNVWNCDRLFRCYYFAKDNYEVTFSGKRAKAEFIREYIADDALYSLYNTLEQVDRMTSTAVVEKSKREEAFDLLFGPKESEVEGEKAAEPRPR